MSHHVTDDEAALRDAAHDFARAELEPIAVAIDREERAPPELTRKLAAQGFFGLLIPQEYGGLGEGLTTPCLVLEELARASPAIAGLVSVQAVLCPRIILAQGAWRVSGICWPRPRAADSAVAD